MNAIRADNTCLNINYYTIADQGVLDFKSRPAIAVNEQQQQQHQTMKTGESSKQAPKETMVKYNARLVK